jgi:hypothetical protein
MRVDKERANPGRLVRGVEGCILARAIAVAAENRPPAAPAAAAGDTSILFDDEIGFIPDQLAIHAKHRAKRSFHLWSRIMRRLQNAHGKRDQRFERRDVVLSSQT